MTTSAPERFNVVIAGGGVAALEAALALRDLAADRVRLTLLAPQSEFVYRPLSVREPFAYAPARRYPLAGIAADVGATLVKDKFGWLDADARVAHTESGEALSYDALVLALGARASVRFPHAITIDDRHMDELLNGLIVDVEGGYIGRIAFASPSRMGWPFPLYELALMTAQRAYDAGVEVSLTVATPEEAPLAIFGVGASHAVAALLDEAGVEFVGSAYVEVPHSRELVINPGDRRIEVDRVVALPDLMGPAVRGIPSGEHGFIPVTSQMQVRGVERVYAAGDAIDFPVKHGGIASQQADVVAESIAALAGAPVEPQPYRPVIRGILLTGGKPRYLTAKITGGAGFSSEIGDSPTWSPPTKVASRYLAPYLERRNAGQVSDSGGPVS
jgi:sulfide:quinone oxidoreductase